MSIPFIIPHFYIVNLGYAGVYLFFLLFFFIKSIDCTYNLLYVWSKNKKNINFFPMIFLYFFNDKKILCIVGKTCLCNVYPFKPHFYIEKLGYAGVYLFFLFLLQNIDCVPTIYVLSKNKKKYPNFSAENFQFLKLEKFFVYCMGKFS